ncbi:hypothetical protein C3433_23915 [Citrobacter freundii]|nr:hypothetical protein C3433_23915 [Citrobacter freundii]
MVLKLLAAFRFESPLRLPIPTPRRKKIIINGLYPVKLRYSKSDNSKAIGGLRANGTKTYVKDVTA